MSDWFDRQKAAAAAPPWWFWQGTLRYGSGLLRPFGNLRVTGGVAPALRRGPLLLAPNHIGNFDTFVIAAAMGRVGLAPRFLVTGGIMTAPIVGPLLERSGNLRVERGKTDAARSMELVAIALRHGAHLCIYQEGRVSLDPGLWPERGKTGLARIALEHQVPVIPIAQWGAHEVTKYEDGLAMLASTVSSTWRRPTLRVHFGEPVDLSDLRADRRGDAIRARNRIAAAQTRLLVPLRAGELEQPRFVDETRPVSELPTAAFPGGVVPDVLP
ncbi:lysophospholipid acyltransferase family protein [Cumulibacter manganitolerans]|uniref:lysophospholipid acyltransferase family protein n=1 Tax=Cumulibacter manganitolerans TaxID=1884992 RepID=UPI0012963024|nr:lysophospholipid acyltransferase family protein [Cumulibacter manganitolerans]